MVKRNPEPRVLEEALTPLIPSFAIPPNDRKVSLMQSAGWVVAAPVFAKYSEPEAIISTMDGIAARNWDTIRTGNGTLVTPGHFARVNTGIIQKRNLFVK